MNLPELWWSDEHGAVIHRGWRDRPFQVVTSTGLIDLDELPSGAAPLVAAQRVGLAPDHLREEVKAVLPAVENLVRSGWVLGTFGAPGHAGADLAEIVTLVIERVDELRAQTPSEG